MLYSKHFDYAAYGPHSINGYYCRGANKPTEQIILRSSLRSSSIDVFFKDKPINCVHTPKRDESTLSPYQNVLHIIVFVRQNLNQLRTERIAMYTWILSTVLSTLNQFSSSKMQTNNFLIYIIIICSNTLGSDTYSSEEVVRTIYSRYLGTANVCRSHRFRWIRFPL